MESIPIRVWRGRDRRIVSLPVAAERRVNSVDRRRASLGWATLFSGADDKAVLDAIDDQEILVLAPGEVLLRPGDPNDAIYLVLAGRLGVHIGEADAGGVIPVLPGECLGELSAIDNKPVSALVDVSETARVLRIAQDAFWNRLMVVPGVARNLLTVLAQRMRRSTQAMLETQRRQLELDYLNKELEVARDLQLGMLPLHRPLFPERRELAIAGMMEPSWTIGGDLFDAFFIDADRLFFCIGDVSGHGIPAAMFMARAVSLMRLAAFAAESPAALLRVINDQLCDGNHANMFVTLFCGFFDVASGRTTYAGAGHPAPLASLGGELDFLAVPRGPALGILPGFAYADAGCDLADGDFLLCFTDGVTEAQSPAGEDYAESRLREQVGGRMSGSPEAMIAAIREEIRVYTGSGQLADDLTLLVLRRTTGGA
ncbi:MAG: cyclic nucleotide-binding domain-containing protein [Betaproteobacteria bacterium]|nr:cyclic nucleotide-binding domain-containing protein [Betaproteobacteria bacterium]